MTLAFAGCSQTGDAQGSGGSSVEVSQSETKEVAQSSAMSDQGSAEGEKETKASEVTASSEPDGMVSAGSKDDMGIDDSWKGVYADFLEKELDTIIPEYDENWRDEWTFGLIYVNDDPMPELVVSSGYEAAGNIIGTVIQGKVEYIYTSRLSFFYKQFGGVLDNADGNMGYYHDYVYRITDKGFDFIHAGNNYEEMDQDGKSLGVHFAMDDAEVTEEAYNKTIEDLIPVKERVYWQKGCTYQDMLNYLKGDTAKNYMEAYRKVISEGVTEWDEELDHFALIERENYDPLLLCAGNTRFCFYAFEDGLLQKGPTGYFSETVFRLVYPGLGIIENQQYFENNEMFDANYFMRSGSLLATYATSEAEYDENWDVLLDASGYPIVNYKINSTKVPKEEFTAYISRNDEKFKQQLVSPKEEYTFIEYFTAEQMLKKL